MSHKQLLRLANIWVNPRNRTKLMTSEPFRSLMASTKAATMYGSWLATPRHHVHNKRLRRQAIASILLKSIT